VSLFSLKPGSLYQFKRYWWFIHNSSQIASLSWAATKASAEACVRMYMNNLNPKEKNIITLAPEQSFFVCLKKEPDHCYKILTTEGAVGWIVVYPVYIIPSDQPESYELIEEVA
jgi:hypothetical protein